MVTPQKTFRTLNPHRHRQIKLNWYYKNRAHINLFYLDNYLSEEDKKNMEMYERKPKNDLPYQRKEFVRIVTAWLKRL